MTLIQWNETGEKRFSARARFHVRRVALRDGERENLVLSRID